VHEKIIGIDIILNKKKEETKEVKKEGEKKVQKWRSEKCYWFNY